MRKAVCGSSRPSINDFCRGGQFLLWATRQWMLAYRHGRSISPCVWQSFAHAGLQRAYTELCRILPVVAFREFPADCFGAPNQAWLTADETAFMKVLGAIEESDARRATDVMHERASPAVARAMLGTSARLIIELHRRGHRIECREASRASYSLRAYEPASTTTTLH